MFSLKRFTSNVAVMLVVCAMFASGCSTLSAQFDPNTLTLTPTAIPKGDYWPTEGWRTTTPEEQRIDSVKLEKMMGDIEKNNYAIESVIIVRNGYIVLEGYPNPEYGPNDRHVLWSATKSVTSALIGIAIKEGFIDSINQTMVDFFPERKIEDIDAGKRQITIEHLLTMTPGYQWGDRTGKPMRNNPNPVQFVLDRPMVSDPGREFNYGDGASHLLSAIIGNTTGSSALDFADAYLFEPLGISNVEWKSDPQGVNFGGSGLFMTPRDMAKVGYLYLNDGIWEGDQLLPKDWVERSTKPINVSSWNGHGYGYQWWTLAQGGVHFAHGLYGQSIFVIPDLEMVVVFTADIRDGHDPEFDFLRIIMGATGEHETYSKYGFTYEPPLGTVIREGGPMWESTSELSGRIQFNIENDQVVNVIWEPSETAPELELFLEEYIDRLEVWARGANYDLEFKGVKPARRSMKDEHELVYRHYSMLEQNEEWMVIFGCWYCNESDHVYIFTFGTPAGSISEEEMMEIFFGQLEAFHCHGIYE